MAEATHKARSSGILARLVGADALREREAATTRRIEAQRRVEALCEERETPANTPRTPDPDRR